MGSFSGDWSTGCVGSLLPRKDLCLILICILLFASLFLCVVFNLILFFSFWARFACVCVDCFFSSQTKQKLNRVWIFKTTGMLIQWYGLNVMITIIRINCAFELFVLVAVCVCGSVEIVVGGRWWIQRGSLSPANLEMWSLAYILTAQANET